ncbi:hypothetical protein N7519_006273 [Penicillium mononematosum]|uniref:uncharacterized protein n=1 Tax=Penicillium mononematosum TaxID=268346 RepID=UPI0025477FFE|nr:uncharacterized protein N7519_006273 [Penicillium mononematosum]KAJ6184972.1 hypothetical protein N7519_006273 [Penicillium mononematosum]
MASYWREQSDQYPNTYNHDHQLLSRTRHSFRFPNVSCINKSRRRVVNLHGRYINREGVCLSPLGVVGDSFDIDDPGILSWFMAGYSLTVGTFILVSGRCGDLFGYRRMFIIGFCWIALWSLVAGLSVYSHYILFIFARVFQGIIIPWGMDMSFPAATLMLSNAVERKHQGVAASLVTTVVNYSISLSLGLAGTVEVHVNNGGHTLDDVLRAYRGALYLAVGLGGLGMFLSAIYVFKGYRAERRPAKSKHEEAEG